MIVDFTPPAVNLKCIVFTVILSSGYWYLPTRNKYVLVGLVYFPYLALAWYDWIYACKHNFGPTYLAHFYSWAKPQNSRQIQIYKNWAPSIKRKVLAVDTAIAISLLISLPFFINWKPKKRDEEAERRANNFAIVAGSLVLATFIWLRFNKTISS